MQKVTHGLRHHAAHPVGLLNHLQGTVARHAWGAQGVVVVVVALLSLLDGLTRPTGSADSALGPHPAVEASTGIGHGVRREGVASIRGTDAQVGLRLDGRKDGGEAEGQKEEEGGEADFARPASSPRWWWCRCLDDVHGFPLFDWLLEAATSARTMSDEEGRNGTNACLAHDPRPDTVGEGKGQAEQRGRSEYCIVIC